MSVPTKWPELSADEWPIIEQMAGQANLDPCFIGAIRWAENGGEGKQFGILTVSAPTFTDQCRVYCNTIARYIAEYPTNPLQYVVHPRIENSPLYVSRRVLYTTAFIEYVSHRYAPVGAGNDPQGLNNNWINNVSQWYRRLADI